MRRGLAITALGAVVLVCAAAGWFGLAGWKPAGRWLLHRASAREGGTWRLEAGRLGGNLFTGIELDSVLVARRDGLPGQTEVARAARVSARWRLGSLLRGELQLTEIVLDSARLWPLRFGPGSVPAPDAASAPKDSAPGPARGPLGAGLLADRVRVRAIQLRGVDLVFLEDPGGAAIRGLWGEIRQGHDQGEWQLEIGRGRLVRDGAEIPLHGAEARAILDAARVQVESLRVEAGGSRATVAASLENRAGGAVRGTVGLDPLSLGDVARLLKPGARVPPGEINGTLELSGTRDSLAVDGSLAGEVRGVPLSLTTLRSAVSREGLKLKEIAGEVGGGWIGGEASLDFLAPGRHEGSFRFRGLDPSLWRSEESSGATPLSGRLAGSFSWKGEGRARDERRLEARLDLAESRLAGARIEELSLDAAIRPDRGASAEMRGVVDGDLLEGSAELSPAGVLTGSGTVRLVGGGSVGRLLGQEEFGAQGELRLRLRGTRSEPGLWLAGRLTDIRLPSLRAETADLAAEWVSGRKPHPLSASLDAEGIRLGALPPATLSCRAIGNLGRLELRDVTLRSGPLRLSGACLVERGRDRLILTTMSLAVETGDLSWRAREPARIEITPQAARLEPFSLEAGEAVLRAEGRMRGDSLSASVALQGLELRRLGAIPALGGPVAGLVELHVSLGGTRARPAGRADISLTDAVVRGLPIKRLTALATVEDGRLRLEEGAVETAGGGMEVTGELPLGAHAASDGELRVTTRDLRLSYLRSLWPALERVEARADLVLQGTGLPDRPVFVLAGEANGVQVAGQPLGQLAVSARWADEVLHLEELGVDGPSGKGHVTGTVALLRDGRFPAPRRLAGPVALEARVEDGDLGLVPLFLPREVSGAEGRFAGRARVVGTVEAPILSGELEVFDGLLALPTLVDTARAVNGKATFEGNRFRVERLTARQGRAGKVSVTGEGVVRGRELAEYRMAVSVDRYEPHLWRGVSGVGDVRLVVTPERLSSGRVVPHLVGEVEVHELLVELELPEPIPADEAVMGPPVAPIPPLTTFALQLRGEQNLRLQNKDVSMELAGELFARSTEEGIVLLGELRSIRGRYFLYNHSFDIRRGVFTFSDVRDMGNVGLDVLGETNVGGEKITVTITGSLRDPQVETTSASGWNETEIFRTLTLGAPPGSATGGFTSGLIGSWREALLDRLGGQVARGIGVDEIRLKPGTENGEARRLEVGKRLWSDVYLNFQTTLGTAPSEPALADAELRDPERLLSLEYRLSEKFSLDGEAGTRRGVEFLNMDLKFRWNY